MQLTDKQIIPNNVMFALELFTLFTREVSTKYEPVLSRFQTLSASLAATCFF